MLCLDTNILRKFARRHPDETVVEYLAQHHAEPWTAPAFVLFEFYRIHDTPQEVLRAQHKIHQMLDDVLPYTEEVAIETVNIENSLAKQDISLDIIDLLHAATAREAGATFVTADKNDFDKQPIHQLLDLDIIYTS